MSSMPCVSKLTLFVIFINTILTHINCEYLYTQWYKSAEKWILIIEW